MLSALHLSPWQPWDDRHLLPECAGVYVIGKGDALQVVYVGRTWGKGGMRDRIRAFHRSATTGQKGHAGGVTYHGKFGPKVDQLKVRVHAPVAINPAQRVLRPYIEYAERRLIWEHVERHGELPACNTE